MKFGLDPVELSTVNKMVRTFETTIVPAEFKNFPMGFYISKDDLAGLKTFLDEQKNIDRCLFLFGCEIQTSEGTVTPTSITTCAVFVDQNGKIVKNDSNNNAFEKWPKTKAPINGISRIDNLLSGGDSFDQ